MVRRTALKSSCSTEPVATVGDAPEDFVPSNAEDKLPEFDFPHSGHWQQRSIFTMWAQADLRRCSVARARSEPLRRRSRR